MGPRQRIGVGGRILSRVKEWATYSGEPFVVGRKSDRAGDISLYDGDHTRVWK